MKLIKNERTNERTKGEGKIERDHTSAHSPKTKYAKL